MSTPDTLGLYIFLTEHIFYAPTQEQALRDISTGKFIKRIFSFGPFWTVRAVRDHS